MASESADERRDHGGPGWLAADRSDRPAGSSPSLGCSGWSGSSSSSTSASASTCRWPSGCSSSGAGSCGVGTPVAAEPRRLAGARRARFRGLRRGPRRSHRSCSLDTADLARAGRWLARRLRRPAGAWRGRSGGSSRSASAALGWATAGAVPAMAAREPPCHRSVPLRRRVGRLLPVLRGLAIAIPDRPGVRRALLRGRRGVRGARRRPVRRRHRPRRPAGPRDPGRRPSAGLRPVGWPSRPPSTRMRGHSALRRPAVGGSARPRR